MEIVRLILLIGIPMGITQVLYRLIDRDGAKTKEISEKFPVVLGHKFFVQIIAPLLFMVFFGLLCVLCHIPIEIFFVICGAVTGVINGMAVTLMYMD